VTLKEAEGDSSLIQQVKATVSLDFEEWYQDEDIQKLMKIRMYLDSRFKKIPYLTEVERTAIWLQARDELVAIIKDDQDTHEGSQSSHACPHAGVPNPSSPPQPKKRKLAKLLGDILETAGHEFSRYDSTRLNEAKICCQNLKVMSGYNGNSSNGWG